MSTAVPLPERPNPHAMVRAWVRARLDKQPGLDLTQLQQEAVAKFKADNAFLDALVAHGIQEITWSEIRHVVSQKRRSLKGTVNAAGETFEESAIKKALLGWYESVRDGNYKPLLQMTRADLAAAIDGRQAQVDGHVAVIDALRKLHDGLPNDKKTVGAHFAPDVLNAIFRHLING